MGGVGVLTPLSSLYPIYSRLFFLLLRMLVTGVVAGGGWRRSPAVEELWCPVTGYG